MKIDEPGLYAMPAAVYHADPCPAPSLSASIAHELLVRSPLHAWTAHPRLNPAYQPEQADKFDLGTAAHAHLLEGSSAFVIVNAPDWKKKESQLVKAEARLAGKVPLLTEQWERVQAMAAAARRQLDRYEERPVPLTGGQPERVLVWVEDGIWCRARVDWLHDDRRTVDDYKSTAASANPEAWSRTLFGAGHDLQAAFYLRGLQAVFGVDATFRFVVQENFPPYALSVIALAPEAQALAEKKVRHVIEAWRHCCEGNVWPAYPTRTCWADLPGWEETRWLEREARTVPAPAPIDDGRPLEEQLFGKAER